MENVSTSPSKAYQLSFQGKGSEYFGIIIVNWLLTVLTLGIYYPWAKARQLKYIYGSTALNDDRFSFHGTGKEMFIGLLKTVLIFAVIYGGLLLSVYFDLTLLGVIIFYAGFTAFMPMAIHGSYRYRMSRTSWRGIRMGYRGDRKYFTKEFIKWFLLTLVTFGLYSAWMTINTRNYVLSNVRIGNVEMKYKGDGATYFFLFLKGYFLTLITLGIYSFWWQKDLFAYYIDNLSLKDEEKNYPAKIDRYRR